MSTADELDTRIGRLEDAAAIRELPERYAQCYGSLDLAGLGELYAEDVELSSGERGREVLVERFRAGSVGERGVRLAVLHVGTHAIDPDGADAAEGRVLCHGEVERADGSWFHQAIHYGDRYVRTPQGWRFGRQRRHELLYGVTPGERPNALPPARWPEHDVGRGTVPERWSTWSRFWTSERHPS